MFREFFKMHQERLEGSALREYKGGLQFKDVGFGFPKSSTPLFESLSLNLESGSILVVVGANGSGKTTLARMIVGLIDPRRGHILVDGVDLAQVVPEWWRKQIVYLPQEPRFLSASIRDNLLAFNPDLDDTAIGRLIDTAGLRRFIDESPEGIDSLLVGNGENLSLGMRRRLSLARALATDGMLAVLDEPTEGLDVAGRKQVYAVMNDLASRGCSIVAFTDDPNIMKGVRFVLDLNTKPVPRLVDQTMGAEARARANQEQPKIGADDDSPSDAAEAPAAPSGGDAVATGNRTVRS
jgi:ATP-binding cassette subfamily C protein LapB